MSSAGAIEQLEHAFATKAKMAETAPAGPRIGVFGAFPEVLAAAAGFETFDVAMHPEADRDLRCEALDGRIEPFLDYDARRFLHRLFSGEFDGLAAIVFARSCAAAHVAYQYASEFRRQGAAQAKPSFVLWNFLHTRTDAARAFNREQARKLEAALIAAGGGNWTSDQLRKAIAAERDRQAALDDLRTAASDGRVSGNEAMRWRNAGRYLPAVVHARLVREACEEVCERSRRVGLRLGLAGSPTAQPWLYALVEEFGTVVADPHPYGLAWPAPLAVDGASHVDALLVAGAANMLEPQSLPAEAHKDAIVQACRAARCDLVVFQLDGNDDSFGWDMPGIRRDIEAMGVDTVDLGFRPGEVDEDWITAARETLAAAVAQRGGRP